MFPHVVFVLLKLGNIFVLNCVGWFYMMLPISIAPDICLTLACYYILGTGNSCTCLICISANGVAINDFAFLVMIVHSIKVSPGLLLALTNIALPQIFFGVGVINILFAQ